MGSRFFFKTQGRFKYYPIPPPLVPIIYKINFKIIFNLNFKINIILFNFYFTIFNI